MPHTDYAVMSPEDQSSCHVTSRRLHCHWLIMHPHIRLDHETVLIDHQITTSVAQNNSALPQMDKPTGHNSAMKTKGSVTDKCPKFCTAWLRWKGKCSTAEGNATRCHEQMFCARQCTGSRWLYHRRQVHAGPHSAMWWLHAWATEQVCTADARLARL